MKQRVSLLKAILRPTWIILGISLVCIVANLFLTQHTRPYTSDDVSWQTILMTWHPFGRHTAYLGAQDNFSLNAIFLAVFSHLMAPGRTLLLVEASVLAVINFTFFYIACLYFLKKCNIRRTYATLLPFLWLATFGYNLGRLFLNTNWRNFEVGSSFILFMLAAMVYFGELEPLKSRKTKLLTLLVSVVAGLFVYDDPYFLYFTVLPIAALFIVLYCLKKISRNLLLTVLGGVILSIVLPKVIKHIMANFGLLIPQAGSLTFVDYSRLFGNVSLAFQGLLTIFGAQFFGTQLVSLSSFTALLDFGLLAFVAYRIYKTRPHISDIGHRTAFSATRLWSCFFGLLCLFVTLVYIVDNGVVDIYSYRYLVVVAFIVPLLLALYSHGASWQTQRILAGMAVAAIVLNVLSAVHDINYPQTEALGNVANAANYQIIQAVKKTGVTKGYAPYWDGNINTYLSGGSIHFLPVLCSNEQTQAYELLVDSSLFQKSSGKSFYLYDPDVGSPPTCSIDELTAQFGKPDKTVPVLDKTILIYNYDIASKMAQATSN